MAAQFSRRQFLSAAAIIGLTGNESLACWKRRQCCHPVSPSESFPSQPLQPQLPQRQLSQPGVQVRPNILSLNGQQLESLKRGVAAMKALPASDPRSWTFQAAIHGVSDPTISSPLFSKCQHGNLHFLPWHRAYLYHFERILRAASGDPNLSLPYWDWATNPVLPEPYRIPADSSNPLYDDTRYEWINGGAQLTPNIVGKDLNDALSSPDYSGTKGFSPQLEKSPHGTAHMQIGGHMTLFETAGLDPIFWLHHANIDRLWNVWLNQGGGRANPSDWGLPNPPGPYSFANESGQTVTVEVGQIVSSAQLGYQYQGVINPVSVPAFLAQAKPVTAAPPTRVAASSSPADKQDIPLEKAEAKSLGYRVERVKLNTVKEARKALTQMVPAPGVTGRIEPRHLVVIEGLTADKPPTATYEVYLNLPEKEERDPTARSKYYLGSIDFFGKTRSSKRKSDHVHAEGGDGFTETFDATQVIARLQQERRWDPDTLSIVVIPITSLPPGGNVRQMQARVAAGIEEANVKYKRVSLRTVAGSGE